MKLISNDPISIQAEKYSAKLIEKRPALLLTAADGTVMGELALVFSAHTLNGRDVSSEMTPWRISERGSEITLTCRLDSCVWDEKIVDIRFCEDRIVYTASVEGRGDLTDLELLGGFYTGSNRAVSNARLYSGFRGDWLFNPEPDCAEVYRRGVYERSLIDLTGVPIPGRDGWFFTPPVFCYVLKHGEACMTLGISAEPGTNDYTEFEYTGGSGQELILRYEGYTHVDGFYRLPSLHMIFGRDEYELISEFSARKAEDGARPDWWTRPIFCGWGAQSALSGEMHCPAPQLSNQIFYERFTASLDEKRIEPGTVVIDDKWQRSYGLNDVDTDKWPDMKRFIADMHSKGRKVLLWLKAWDPEGVSPRLCIRDFRGKPQSIDPENPEYIALFDAACREMLSPEGLDADGFKIDFTARIPTCPGCQRYGRHWGLELMRAYLAMVHDSAKRVKPDALIMCHCPHPYLADKLDMIRLNDINIARPVCPQMIHRAKLVKAVLPDKLIDTDNWPMPDKRSLLEYVSLQPELGVPSLYYLWHMDNSPEDISDADLDTVRAAWAVWNEKRKAL
ncbi:MAG: hypothetical protein IKR85_03480 [Clostridia bacterium]|nr:hypothetical protein [Clostridia bacterium]